MKQLVSFLGTAVTVHAAFCTTPPMSVRGANTFLLRGYAQALKDGDPFITYEHGVAWRALEMVYNATQNASYVDYITNGVDNIVTDDGSLLDYNLTYYSLDDIRIGETLIYL